jgi:hypothetical protein
MIKIDLLGKHFSMLLRFTGSRKEFIAFGLEVSPNVPIINTILVGHRALTKTWLHQTTSRRFIPAAFFVAPGLAPSPPEFC